ncbi:MAG: hypothetical protein IJE07_06225 [Clostridia bacterium]|nr:hypothetical protein [Clostridia bacterium]
MQTTMTTRAEQQARWLLWQMGSVTVDGAGASHARMAAPPEPPAMAEPRRSRYDAVIRRMQQAGQRTGTYTPWA